MFRVDVDAHIDESEATWEYLDDGARRFLDQSLVSHSDISPFFGIVGADCLVL